jgi:hypothetical protein
VLVTQCNSKVQLVTARLKCNCGVAWLSGGREGTSLRSEVKNSQWTSMFGRRRCVFTVKLASGLISNCIYTGLWVADEGWYCSSTEYPWQLGLSIFRYLTTPSAVYVVV